MLQSLLEKAPFSCLSAYSPEIGDVAWIRDPHPGPSWHSRNNRRGKKRI